MSLPFMQRIIVAAWKAVLAPGGPTAKIPDPWNLPDLPSDPNAAGATGYDIGSSIPDVLGMIVLGTTSVGDATAFVTGGVVTGLSGLAANVDPNNPDLDGLTFTPNTGSPTSMTCSLTVPSLTLNGGWTIDQEEEYVPGSGGCQAGPMMAMAGVEPSNDNLSLLTTLKNDLLSQGGSMGAWYVSQYYANQTAVQNLLTNSLWSTAVQQYSGNQVWGDILAAIQAASGGQSPTLTASDTTNAIALVSAAMQVSTDQDFVNTINEILNYLPAYQNPSTGQSYPYQQLLTIVASQTPPADFTATFRRPRMTMSFGPSPVDTTQTWNGTLTATATGTTATATFSITAGDGGGAPTVACTGFVLTLPNWSLNYSGSGFASDFMVWLQKTFEPSATSGINTEITNAVNSDTVPPAVPASPHAQILTLLTEQVNSYLTKYWNNPPTT